MKRTFEDFIGLYSVAKTLRFELKPVGKTLENVRKGEFLAKDATRAEQYRRAKKIIDAYHKAFIEEAFAGFEFPEGTLKEFADRYAALKQAKRRKKEKKEDGSKPSKEELKKREEELKKRKEELKKAEKDFQSSQETMRKNVVAAFKREGIKDKFANLFKKELIREKLPAWSGENLTEEQKQDKTELLEAFSKFTTYFKGFHENRRNFYVDKEQSTAIAFRVVHQNLTKFLDNVAAWEKFIETYGKDENWLEFQAIAEKETAEERDGKSLAKIFSVEHFEKCLNQTGIDRYNAILGGKTTGETGGVKKRGVNEALNLFRQRKIRDGAHFDKKSIPGMIELFKQILSDRVALSFLPQAFEDDGEVVKSIGEFYATQWIEKDEEGKTNAERILELLEKLAGDDFDLEQIYLRRKEWRKLSFEIFGVWSLIDDALLESAKRNGELAKDEKALAKLESNPEKWEKAKRKWEKETAYLPLETVENAVREFLADKANQEKVEDWKREKENDRDERYASFGKGRPLTDYFKGARTRFPTEKKRKREDGTEEETFEETLEYRGLRREIQERFETFRTAVEPYAESKDSKLIQQKDEVRKVKSLMDALMTFHRFCKPLYVDSRSKKKEEKGEGLDKDNAFYGAFEPCYESLRKVIPLYDKTRNYFSRKPYGTGKYKLNFEEGALAEGWDVNREKANLCVLLRREGNYYLAVMDKRHKHLFDAEKFPEMKAGTREEHFEKVVYRQISDAAKDIQNLIEIKAGTFLRFTKNLDELKKHIPEIAEIKNKGTYMGENVVREDLDKFIEYYKRAASSYWKEFDLTFKPTAEYANFKDFTDHINAQGYKVRFSLIAKHYIDRMVDEGKLYLFQIYNKDFSPNSKGRKNLHTLYWQALFAEKNLAETPVVFKLSGGAELFYREKTLDGKTVHRRGEKLVPRNDSNGRAVPDEIRREIGAYWNGKKRYENLEEDAKKIKEKLSPNEFRYDIVKDGRYAEDKFLFHVPLTINFGRDDSYYFNRKVNDYVREHPEMAVIGIDRGERHLAYYAVVGPDRKIIKQGSFNAIEEKSATGGSRKVDYQSKLHLKEKERDEARKSWGTVENIKELKEGYLSRVVHEIALLMQKYHAVVVLEDLNFGFKRGRFKVEKQVYQKLEKMLIDKLNYLVFKDRKAGEDGEISRGYQLTAPFESFSKMGKQTGFLYYLPAYKTSKVCPATGFMNLLDLRYSNMENAKDLIGRFDSVRFNPQAGYFEFAMDYEKFKTHGTSHRKKWTVCTHGDLRYRYDSKTRKSEACNVSAELKALLENKEIEFAEGDELKEKILAVDDAGFFKSLLFFIRLTMELRHAKSGTDEDFILSPVKDDKGRFFDSRNFDGDSGMPADGDSGMPADADANGAYHIALKGLLAMEKIRKAKDETEDKAALAVKNEDWIAYVQSRPG